MDLSPEGIVAYLTTYIDTLPQAIMQGDVFALTVTLIAFFIMVVIINKLTGLLIEFLKKVILFIIVTLAFWQFITMLSARVATEGLSEDTLIFGAAGILIGFIAISTSLYVALRSWTRAQELPAVSRAGEVPGEPGGRGEAAPTAGPAVATPVQEREISAVSMKDTLSLNNLKNDKTLGAVLAYLVVAQFGVFSSKTIPAPSFQVGIAFFAIFIIAGLFFIHFTYHNYLTGLRHLIMAIVVGTIIALILGYFWAGIPLDVLLSPAFFQTDALVALVTGLALSLFMGGKG